LKFKKTLSNWLTNRFLLIIRNEENFAEKRTFSFNYAKLIVFGITFLIIVFAASFYLINTVLFAWLNPEHSMIETNKKIITLSAEVDSLAVEVNRKDVYIMNFRRLLMGENVSIHGDSLLNPAITPSKKDINLDELSRVDIRLRKEIEEEGTTLNLNAKYAGDIDKYFVKPVDGVLTEKYDFKKGDFGVNIATKKNETVKSVADGVVIFVNYTNEGSMIAVQHKNSLVSLYKNNSTLLKEAGEYVHAGDAIALTGNSANATKKYMLHFQLWQEGSPINPEHFISF
jgi:murein DD-endopeptidase MepM/ murein hydrolase activator NlpD